MKKNVIALLLAVIMVSGSVGAVPAFATETTAEEAIAVEKEIFDEQEEATAIVEESDFGLIDDDAIEEEYAQIEEEPVQVDEETENEAVLADEQEETNYTAVATEMTEEDEEERAEIEEPAVVEEKIVTADENEMTQAGDVVGSGTCGKNATWTLTGTGDDLTLTISGRGAMSDNQVFYAPWLNHLSNKQKIKRAIIENGITSIGYRSFYECSNLTNVIIPDSIKKIDDEAFYECSSLTEILLPSNIENIGEKAFFNCASIIGNIVIPKCMKSIGRYAFYGCSSLTSVLIADGVKGLVLSDGAFSGCSSLAELTIGNGVTSIGKVEFSGCCNLTSIMIPETVTSIGLGAFADCNGLTGNFVIPSKVKSIESEVFFGCENLESVTLPDGLESIGVNAFNGCRSLKSITLPNSLTLIDSCAFSGCRSVNSVTIPKSVKTIKSGAFACCDDLTSITLVNTVMSIGNMAFGGGYSEATNATVRFCGTKDQWNKAVGNNDVYYKALIFLPVATKKVTCTNLADNMKVEWEKVSGATSYQVFRDGTLLTTTSLLVIWDKEVKYNVGKKYTYNVVATNKTLGDSLLSRTGTYYRLLPVGIKSLTNPSAGKMTVTYDKCKGCYGYVVRYGLKSDMSDAKVITIKGENALSRTFGGMQKGKTYYVQARTYILDNGVRYYSTYSSTKKITIKK